MTDRLSGLPSPTHTDFDLDYEADVSGCYVCRSALLDNDYEQFFNTAECLIVKIGCSNDIYDRLRELKGDQSRRATELGYQIEAPYAGIKDWKLWRIKQNCDGEDIEQMESLIHARHTRLKSSIWGYIRARLSLQETSRSVSELFVVRKKLIISDFPTIINYMEEDYNNGR